MENIVEKKEREVIDLTDMLNEIVKVAEKTITADLKTEEVITGDIKAVGNSAHVIIPKKYADGKHEAKVFIRKKKEEVAK